MQREGGDANRELVIIIKDIARAWWNRWPTRPRFTTG